MGGDGFWLGVIVGAAAFWFYKRWEAKNGGK